MANLNNFLSSNRWIFHQLTNLVLHNDHMLSVTTFLNISLINAPSFFVQINLWLVDTGRKWQEWVKGHHFYWPSKQNQRLNIHISCSAAWNMTAWDKLQCNQVLLLIYNSGLHTSYLIMKPSTWLHCRNKFVTSWNWQCHYDIT